MIWFRKFIVELHLYVSVCFYMMYNQGFDCIWLQNVKLCFCLSYMLDGIILGISFCLVRAIHEVNIKIWFYFIKIIHKEHVWICLCLAKTIDKVHLMICYYGIWLKQFIS